MSTARSNPTGEWVVHAFARGAPPFGVWQPLGLNFNIVEIEERK